jgi:8-oxo-dGTP diphosphatase
MLQNKITIGTVCFLFDKKKFLLLERANEPMKNMMTGVGGKTNFDEDIQASCIREIKEETGFDAKDLRLKGVVKTILSEQKSSWILFVYTCDNFSGKQIQCPEGKLIWVDEADLFNCQFNRFYQRNPAQYSGGKFNDRGNDLSRS